MATDLAPLPGFRLICHAEGGKALVKPIDCGGGGGFYGMFGEASSIYQWWGEYMGLYDLTQHLV